MKGKNQPVNNTLLLRATFLTGAIADAVIAIEWYLISLGLADLPVHPSFFIGDGEDFRYILSVGALFMASWAFLLYWASRRPVERRGILLITSVMLFIAILSDYIIFAHMFSVQQAIPGTSVKLFLVALFAGSYWHSKKLHG